MSEQTPKPKRTSPYLAASLVILVLFGIGMMNMQPAAFNVVAVDTGHYVGEVNFVQVREGQVIANITSHNVITTLGSDYLKTQLASTKNTTALVVYLGLSNDNSSYTPAATNTSLNNEITTGNMSRVAGTYASLGTGQWKISYTWTSSATFGNISQGGLFWSSSVTETNVMFAINNFTGINVISGDTINETWSLTFA
jgi:hypothetical protein